MMSLIRDHETLVAALWERGVDYLTPSNAELKFPVDDESLIVSLAGHSEARLRQALIALFLLQPELAPLAPRLRNNLDARAARELVAYYMAALYLQAMWRTRLGFYLKTNTVLPDYFSIELALPPASEEYGKVARLVCTPLPTGMQASRLFVSIIFRPMRASRIYSFKVSS